LNQAKAHIADFRNGFADGFMHLARQKNRKKKTVLAIRSRTKKRKDMTKQAR